MVASGYWRPDTTTLDGIRKCRDPAFCMPPPIIDGVDTSSCDVACTANHTGPLCDQCVNGTAKIYGTCEPCEAREHDWWIVLLIGFGVVVVAVLAYKGSQACMKRARRYKQQQRRKARPRRDTEKLKDLTQNGNRMTEKWKVFVSYVQQVASFTRFVAELIFFCRMLVMSRMLVSS